MNSTCAFVVLLIILTAQAAVPDYSIVASRAADEMRRRLQSNGNCLDLLGLPLTVLLFATNESYMELCGSQTGSMPNFYFQDCLNEFDNNCRQRGCDSSSLRPWVTAFTTGGAEFVCGKGIKYIHDYGSRDCAISVQMTLGTPMSTLYNKVLNGYNVTCSNVKEYMIDILDVLSSCGQSQNATNNLGNLVKDYFNHVIDLTPCKNEIHIGSGSSSSLVSSFSILSAIAVPLIVYSKL